MGRAEEWRGLSTAESGVVAKTSSCLAGVENQHAPARELAHRTHANLTLDHVTAVEAAVWSSTTSDGLFGNRLDV